MKKFLGRKLLVWVVYGIFTWANRQFDLGLETADLFAIGGAGGLYMLSQAYEDAKKEKK